MSIKLQIILLLLALVSLTACISQSTLLTTPTPITRITSSPTPAATTPPTPQPTLRPKPTLTPAPEPMSGMVSGDLCYPSSLAPPLTLYLEDLTTGEAMALEIDRGETSYRAALPPGEYVAYAHTIGTEVWGGYTSRGARQQGSRGEDLLPFEVVAGKTLDGIDLCDWDHQPGFRAPVDTADETVLVTTVQNTNLYPYPSLTTERLAVAPPRTTVKAVARTPDNAWFQIEALAGDRVWLYGRLTQVQGNIFNLPMIEPHKNLVQILADYDRPRDQFSPTAWSAGENEAIVHFRGFIRDKYRRPVNGYSILLDNGTWSVLSHPSGASHHYPDTDDGEWDLIIKNAADAAGWWSLTVVSYDCPDFEIGFNAQCKQFTPLSETQVVQVVYPDENVIFADWLCLRDCDHGLYVEAYRRPEDIAAAEAASRRANYIENFYRGDIERLRVFYPYEFLEPSQEGGD